MSKLVANQTVKLKCGLTAFDGHEYTVRTECRDGVELHTPVCSFRVSWEEKDKFFDTVPA